MVRRGRYILLLAVCLCLEAALSMAGFRPPLLPLCALAMGMRRQALRSLPESLIAAAMLDALWGHALPTELLAVLMAAALAAGVARFSSAFSWATMALAGACVGLMTAALALAARGGVVGAGRLLGGQLLGGLLGAPLLGALWERFLRADVLWNPGAGGVPVEEEEGGGGAP